MNRAPREPNQIPGLSNLANIISAEFGIACSRQLVKRWQLRKPPFPLPVQNRFDREACFAWVRENVMSKLPQNQQQLDLAQMESEAVSRRKITASQKEQFEFDLLREKYVEREVAKRTFIGELRKFHSWIKGEFERNLTDDRRQKLSALGVSPEIVDQFCDYDVKLAQAAIDRVEVQCEQTGKNVD